MDRAILTRPEATKPGDSIPCLHWSPKLGHPASSRGLQVTQGPWHKSSPTVPCPQLSQHPGSRVFSAAQLWLAEASEVGGNQCLPNSIQKWSTWSLTLKKRRTLPLDFILVICFGAGPEAQAKSKFHMMLLGTAQEWGGISTVKISQLHLSPVDSWEKSSLPQSPSRPWIITIIILRHDQHLYFILYILKCSPLNFLFPSHQNREREELAELDSLQMRLLRKKQILLILSRKMRKLKYRKGKHLPKPKHY